jgi:hypothetical protein
MSGPVQPSIDDLQGSLSIIEFSVRNSLNFLCEKGHLEVAFCKLFLIPNWAS